MKDSTFQSYRNIVENHAIPYLQTIKLKDLRSVHLRSLLRTKLDEGYAPRTVQYLRTLVRKAMEQAVIDDLLVKNPMLGVKSPKVIAKEYTPLNPRETAAFLAAAHETGDRFEALYVLAVLYGPRKGELLGLKWEDVDFDQGTLHIRRTLARIENGRPVFTTPKNTKSVRRIDLNDRTLEVLTAHRTRQIEESATFAGLWQDLGLIFTTTIGTPVSRQNLDNRSFKPLLQRAGLRNIRFHDLRHGCATFLMGSGEHVREVQELLGHSTSKTTLDIYSHVAPGGGRRLADAIDDALRRS